MKFAKILYHLGFGKFQIYLFVLVGVLQIFGGLQLNSNKFYMLSFGPKSSLHQSRCYVPNCDNATSGYHESWVHYAIPQVGSDDDSLDSHECSYFKSNYANDTSCSNSSFTKELIECDEWKWDDRVFVSTVVSDFKLVCKSKSNKAMSEALFMAGVLTGSLTFGHASDRWGRKSIFLVAPALLATSSIATAFSNSLPLFSFLRFLTAASVSGLFQTGYILAIEFVGKTKRLWCANSLQMIFAVGELLLAGAAAISKKNWKTLQLIISVPTIGLLGYNWLMPESARWQISKNQFQKAKSTILKAASWNKVTIPENLLRSSNEEPGIHNDTRQQRSNPIDLVKTPVMRKWTLNLLFNWIINSMVYYGLSLSAANLSSNVYISFSVMALVEIPAIAFSTVLLKKLGRRPVLCWIMIFGGISCLTTAFIPKIYATILAIFGKAAIGASFSIIYIYSSEIYPTVLRNTGIGISSMCARIGSMIAPFIAGMRQFHSKLPMIIFGVCTIIAGLLAFLLPETRNRELPENVEEAESLKSNASSDAMSQIDSRDDEERLRLLAG